MDYTENDIFEASERAELYMAGIDRALAVFSIDEQVWVTEENGDVRFTEWAQDIFNEVYDDEMERLLDRKALNEEEL